MVPGGPIEDPWKSHQEPPGLYLMGRGGSVLAVGSLTPQDPPLTFL